MKMEVPNETNYFFFDSGPALLPCLNGRPQGTGRQMVIEKSRPVNYGKLSADIKTHFIKYGEVNHKEIVALHENLMFEGKFDSDRFMPVWEKVYAEFDWELSILYQEAQSGDAESQSRLALKYYRRKEYGAAAKWYRKAAEAGNPNAQYWLGILYFFGDGVLQDYKEGIVWTKKSAENWHLPAYYALGQMYEEGRKVPKDFVEAYMWHSVGAVMGCPSCPDGRDALLQKMTQSNIALGQYRAKKWLEDHPIDVMRRRLMERHKHSKHSDLRKLAREWLKAHPKN